MCHLLNKKYPAPPKPKVKAAMTPELQKLYSEAGAFQVIQQAKDEK